MTNKGYTILADMRWPIHTGIGQVQKSLFERKPNDINIVDLNVYGRIGHPFSPLRVAKAIKLAQKPRAVFLSVGFIPPLLACQRSVVFVHDLTHLKYYGPLYKIYYNNILRPLYRRCAAIICPCDYSGAEFYRWSKIRRDRLHVVKVCVGNNFLSNKNTIDLGYKYIIYPGNHRKYKNMVRLVRAYAMSKVMADGIHLLFTGREEKQIIKLSRDLGIDDYVHFLGVVSSENMPALYRGALAIVFVSLYEGFGLPILEGMASDVPVITSISSSMPEVAGGAAFLVDPFSVDAIAAAIKKVTLDQKLRDELIKKGRKRVKDFSWDISAEKFWAVVRDVCATHQAHLSDS